MKVYFQAWKKYADTSALISSQHGLLLYLIATKLCSCLNFSLRYYLRKIFLISVYNSTLTITVNSSSSNNSRTKDTTVRYNTLYGDTSAGKFAKLSLLSLSSTDNVACLLPTKIRTSLFSLEWHHLYSGVLISLLKHEFL